ncbi:MAG: RlmE family RNA methyltransferase [Proteobacteria bacterium]|nr:RlmE family RNA methyltransferase [Pseudomonadota bacterium]
MSKYVLKDTFFKKAKEEGYRARSAYKLKEIQNKFHLIKKGDKVLDLGCSPGSFLQVISDIVGYEGVVVGIDILPLTPLPKKNVSTIIRDVRELSIKELLNELSLQYFDVVTCDIAPNLSGIREVDEKNITELYEAVKNIVSDGLKTGGKFLLKSFFSGTFRDIDSDLKNIFKNVTIYKPVASRSKSSEIYLVCINKK